MNFRLEATLQNCRARAGVLDLPHGKVNTPVFMPVGTQATVRGIRSEELDRLSGGIILSNAFHLYLRPGMEIIRKAGGIHEFMCLPANSLTDSGGYQVFSLAALRRIDENGVRFRSPVDGSAHEFTPEKVMEIERDIGADIIMAFDECAPYPCDREYAKSALERTLRWASRCRSSFEDDNGRALFGIVQGGVYPDLRQESALRTVAIGFGGYAVGGLSVGETKTEMSEALEAALSCLPADAPRYLMGVGLPPDILNAVAAGADMFDCVLPARMGRNGTLFTRRGRINIRNASHAEEMCPVEDGCSCPVCLRYSRAYLRHLFKAGEMLGGILATTHNLWFYRRMMEETREAITRGRLLEYIDSFMQDYGCTNY